jgi:hypothetical protein
VKQLDQLFVQSFNNSQIASSCDMTDSKARCE